MLVTKTPKSNNNTIATYIAKVQKQLAAAKLYFGHGTDNPETEAIFLIFSVMNIPMNCSDPAVAHRQLTIGQRRKIDALVERRIKERKPAAYLTHEAWFAGLPFFVDGRVLIPRSPFAELIEQRFQPWIAPRKVKRILDIGTGSGCIAIACAKAFPKAKVDAVDISPAALKVARRNVKRHKVASRVRLFCSDVFSEIKNQKYDVIISNPPYVLTQEFASLPKEYRHEPKIALAAGKEGLNIVDKILQDAAKFLTSSGILLVEVGNAAANLIQHYPHLQFIWLEFASGESEIFLLLKNKKGSSWTAL